MHYVRLLIFTLLLVLTYYNAIIILNIPKMAAIINYLLELVFLLMKVNNMDSSSLCVLYSVCVLLQMTNFHYGPCINRVLQQYLNVRLTVSVVGEGSLKANCWVLF